METAQKVDMQDLLAAINLIDAISKSTEQLSPEEQIDAELKKKGCPRPKDIPIQTKNSLNEEVANWLEKIEPEIKTAEQSDMKNHAAWLFDLCISLINERAQVDQEIHSWRALADGMTLEWMRSTMKIKGEPLGRKMPVQPWQGVQNDPTLSVGQR